MKSPLVGHCLTLNMRRPLEGADGCLLITETGMMPAHDRHNGNPTRGSRNSSTSTSSSKKHTQHRQQRLRGGTSRIPLAMHTK
jgi:hypothetical protein